MPNIDYNDIIEDVEDLISVNIDQGRFPENIRPALTNAKRMNGIINEGYQNYCLAADPSTHSDLVTEITLPVLREERAVNFYDIPDSVFTERPRDNGILVVILNGIDTQWEDMLSYESVVHRANSGFYNNLEKNCYHLDINKSRLYVPSIVTVVKLRVFSRPPQVEVAGSFLVDDNYLHSLIDYIFKAFIKRWGIGNSESERKERG